MTICVTGGEEWVCERCGAPGPEPDTGRIYMHCKERGYVAGWN